MEFNPHDQDIIRLLTRLKDVPLEYPDKMLVAQRQSYLKQMAAIDLGTGAGNGIRNTKLPGPSSTISTLLETALIVAIVAEASIMTYFYREKLAHFFQGLTAASGVEEVAPPSVVPTSVNVQRVDPSPAVSSTLPPTAIATETTGTPTSTSVPKIAGDHSSTPPGVSAHSTPVPNGNKGNNGHHYGQTPKPERTKENNGNSGNNSNPPKDKPTKTK